MEKYYLYPLDKLKQFEKDVFIGMGVLEDEAEICADVLNAADRRGIDSHGIGRLKPIYYDRIVYDKVQLATTEFVIERDTAATAVVNGNNGMGFVVAAKSMDMAIAKARTYGIGMVIAKNSTHYGIAAYYPIMATQKEMIGITGTNARPSTAPTWSVENMLGTNPLVFAVPTDEPFPFTNDNATSTSQRGKIELYAREGKELPPGWVIGADGRSKTDPHEVLADLTAGRAALTPLGGIGEELGGHKGYGFATVVELLSAGMQMGAFLKQLNGVQNGQKVPILLGHFFIAIDIAHFHDVAEVKKQMGDILRTLRLSNKAADAERIYTHGEKEYLHSLERSKSGVPLPQAVCKQMSRMRDELRLDYAFEWD
jgi:L-2-hydroxycarboxylate dehydrogenase (NAD+)